MESQEILIRRLQDHNTGRVLDTGEASVLLQLMGTVRHVDAGWALTLNESIVQVDDPDDPTDIRDYGSGQSLAYYHDGVMYVYADDVRDMLSDDIDRQRVSRISLFMDKDTMSVNARSLIELLYSEAEISDFVIEDPDDIDGVVETIIEATRDAGTLIMVLASPAIVVALAMRRCSFVHITDGEEFVELYAVDGDSNVQSCVAIA